MPLKQAKPMPIYYFNVNDGCCTIPDLDGIELAADDAAREHAVLVARELMRNAKPHVRNWRIQVQNSERELLLNLLFASVDDRLDILSNDLRRSVEQLCGNLADLGGSVQSVRMNLRRVRATLARADRLPYVVAINGQQVDPAA
jgi:hypothetical protein